MYFATVKKILVVCAMASVVSATPQVCEAENPRPTSTHWNTDASCPSTKLPVGDWEHKLCDLFTCLVKVAMSGGNFDYNEIITCITNAKHRGESNSIQFNVRNSGAVDTEGFIANAVLTWGKWQVNGVDVTSVNGLKFTNKNGASFKALGRKNSPSGAEGSFDIMENKSDLAATVSFSIPFWGDDKVDVKNADGSTYVCTQRETLFSGALSYDITCHKIISN